MTKDEYLEYTKVEKKDAYHYFTPSFMPNGVYRFLVRFYSDIDTAGYAINYQYEQYFRLNDEQF